jgi:hypothetical protein
VNLSATYCNPWCVVLIALVIVKVKLYRPLTGCWWLNKIFAPRPWQWGGKRIIMSLLVKAISRKTVIRTAVIITMPNRRSRHGGRSFLWEAKCSLGQVDKMKLY